MEYELSAKISLPADVLELDTLQRIGAATLLDERLDLLAGIEGPDGVEIDPIDHEVTVHSSGARITLVLDAPTLTFAEVAARSVLTAILQDTELLADWTVDQCQVNATPEQLAAALDGSAESSVDEDEDEGEGAELESLTEEELAAQRAQLLESGEQLRAFGLDAFGHSPENTASKITAEQARLAAGAVMQAVELLTDELFQDIQELEEFSGTAADDDALWVIDELPERYADRYTALFAKQFLVTTAILGYRLCQPEWQPPLCTAEALALHLVKSKAETLIDLADLDNDVPLDDIFAAFDEHAFDNLDHELLYDTDADEDAPGLAFDEWFQPRAHVTTAIHPYLVDDELIDQAAEV